MMYGSNKKGGQVYRLTHVYDYKNKRIDDYIYDYPNLLVSCTAIRFFTEDDKLILKNEFTDNLYLMEMLTKATNKYGRKKNKNENIIKVSNYYTMNKDSMINLKYIMAKKLTAILSRDRASQYNDWIRVCWCLKNIDEGLFNDFVEFSKKTKFDNCYYEDCVKVWKRAKILEDGFSLGSLNFWAKEDDPERYKEIIIENTGL